MDKYFGIHRAEVHLTDNSVYYLRSGSNANKSVCYSRNANYDDNSSYYSKGRSNLDMPNDESFDEAFDEYGQERGIAGDIIYCEDGKKLFSDDSKRLFSDDSKRLFSDDSKRRFEDDTDYLGYSNNEDYEGSDKKHLDSDVRRRSDDEPLYRVREDYGYSKAVAYKGRKPRRGYFFGALIRVAVAAALFLAVFGMSKVDLPFFKQVTETIKNAITYDLDKSEDKQLGEITAVSKLEKLKDEQDDD